MAICPHCMANADDKYSVCARCGGELGHDNGDTRLPVGTVLQGRYYVGACIGGGGFGLSYVGLDMLLNMKVAIKEYFPSSIANRGGDRTVSPATGREDSFKSGKTRFLKESKLLSMFSGDGGIVEAQDYFNQNGTAYIIMEYLEGRDLRALLNERGKLPFEEALTLLEPAMLALDRIHKKGVVHCDISPSNIILQSNGRPKLIDFGAARNLNEAAEDATSMVLKPGYAPPELLRAAAETGPWTDVYSISASLYALITGKTPDSAADRGHKDRLPPPSKLGVKLSRQQERALMKGMSLKAEDRIQSCKELLSYLKEEKLLKQPFSAKKLILPGVAAAALAAVLLVFGGGDKPQPTATTAHSPTPTATPVPLPVENEEIEFSIDGGTIVSKTKLREDAFPVPLYMNMEKVEGFERQKYCSLDLSKDIVNNRVQLSGSLDSWISECYFGNGQLCLVLDVVNNSDERIKIDDPQILVDSTWSMNAETRLDSGDDYIEPWKEVKIPLWISTDFFRLRGVTALSSVMLKPQFHVTRDIQVYGIPDLDNSKQVIINLPKALNLGERYQDDSVRLATVEAYNGIAEVSCYGASLLEQFNSGSIYIKSSLLSHSEIDSYNTVLRVYVKDKESGIPTKGQKFVQFHLYDFKGRIDERNNTKFLYKQFEISYGDKTIRRRIDENNVRYVRSEKPLEMPDKLEYYIGIIPEKIVDSNGKTMVQADESNQVLLEVTFTKQIDNLYTVTNVNEIPWE